MKSFLKLTALLTLILCTSCTKYTSNAPVAQSTLPSPIEIEKPIQVALVLGSGGARGIAHLGVIEELEKANIPIDLIVGCSMGSIVGSLYADCPNSQNLKDKMLQLKRRHIVRYNPFKSRGGIWQTKHMKQFLEKALKAKTYEELQIPLITVSTDLNTGQKVVLSKSELPHSVCASSTVPFFFQPISIYGRTLIDGGVVDPLPVEEAKKYNPDIIIAVDVSGQLDPIYKKNIYRITQKSYQILNMQHNYNCSKEAHFVIKPKINNSITFLNDKSTQELYEAGREATLEIIDQIKEKLDTLEENKS